MRLGIKHLVKSTLERARGTRGRTDSGFRSAMLNPFVSLLKQLHFAPGHIIDVGTNRGASCFEKDFTWVICSSS